MFATKTNKEEFTFIIKKTLDYIHYYYFNDFKKNCNY